ncbi:hypothetical protein ACF0H5_022339 [Mactra antiquata]
MAETWILFSVLFILFSQNGESTVCTSGNTVGSGNIATASVNSPDAADVNVTILLANTLGTIQCCGVITGWNAYLEGRAFVSFHVWRPVSGSPDQYLMLGTNGFRHRREITVSGILTPSYPSTTYVVAIRITDVCTGSDVCNATITVTNEPKGITFTSLPAAINVEAWSVGTIHSFQISRQRDVDNATCSVKSTLPENAAFQITSTSTTEFAVGVTDTTGLGNLTSVVIFISCQNMAGFSNESNMMVTLVAKQDSTPSQTSRSRGIFATLLALIGVIVLFSVVTIVIVLLVKKGKLQVWPNQNQIKTNKINVAENNNTIKTTETVHERIELKRQKTWHHNKSMINGNIWNNYGHLHIKELSTLTRYREKTAHFYPTSKHSPNGDLDIGRTSLPADSVARAENKNFHQNGDNSSTKRPWIP